MHYKRQLIEKMFGRMLQLESVLIRRVVQLQGELDEGIVVSIKASGLEIKG